MIVEVFKMYIKPADILCKIWTTGVYMSLFNENIAFVDHYVRVIGWLLVIEVRVVYV